MSALPHAWRRVELEPWQEPGQRALMRLLALGGQRGAALAQYEALRRLLAEDLGCPPAPKTQRLVEQIKKGALADFAGRSQTPPHNLPAPLIPFIGRETELAAVKDCLEEPGCRLLTLVGPGGSGKTRLALEAARAQLQNFDGVYLVSLAPLRSADDLVPAVVEALNLPLYDEKPPRQQLLDYVRQKRVLLILDNMEHLLDGVRLVVDLLRAAPGVKILSTSRAKLYLKGETLYAIAGMKYPHAPPCAAQDASQYSAVQLFVSSARRACPGFALRAGNLPHVVHICHLLEGLPLGILLAAAWMGALSAAEIASQLVSDAGQGLDLLKVDWGDVPGRHRSLRAVFDHSWQLLTPRERGVFQALSVFRGGFTSPAAKAVAGATLQDLTSLAGKSFLQRDARGRYQVHELLRQYTAEKLVRSPAASAAAHERHCAYYTGALETWGVDLKGSGQQAALAELDQEIENARLAWDWVAGRGQVERLERAVEGLCRFYSWRLRHAEGEEACRLAAEGLRTIATGDGLRLLARIVAWQSALSAGLGSAKSAGELLEQSQACLARPELGDRDARLEQAFLLFQKGQRAFGSDWEHARRLYEQSLALYRALGDDWCTASVLDRLGWLAVYLSDFDEAIQGHRQSLALRRALSDTTGIADTLRSLGAALHVCGRFEDAEQLLREAVSIWRESDDRLGIAQGLGQLGPGLVSFGRPAEAYEMLQESLEIYDGLGHRSGAMWSATFLGLAEIHLGRYEQARLKEEWVLEQSREIGDPFVVARATWLLGRIALAEGACVEAQTLLEESVAIYSESGLPHERVLAGVDLIVAACRVGRLDQAQVHLDQALRTATQVQAGIIWGPLLPAAALLSAYVGEPERAIELYAVAVCQPFVANSLWIEGVIGVQIAAVAATLPPDVVAAARARGRARDLEVTIQELLGELGC